MRARILRWYGVSCPPDVAIYEGVYFSSNRVVFGQGCFVNARCFFEAGATITLGDAVHVGPGTSIISSTRAGGGHDRRAGALQKFDVQIGAGCWLGANVTVLLGVRIGDGCLIAAGAVVTRDCLPDGLYAGVPARRVRDLGDGPGQLETDRRRADWSGSIGGGDSAIALSEGPATRLPPYKNRISINSRPAIDSSQARLRT
ncbi:acyltransferase [Sphingomonas sp. UBA978]|nr:acyltransferase [Sphingomonas sp. UBA978]